MKKQLAEASAEATDNVIVAAGTTALDAPIDFAADAGDGVEFGMQDLQVPYLKLLQSNSPEKDESDPKYVDGAEEGMIINSATMQLIKGRIKQKNDDGELAGLEVIPCMYSRKLVEWKPERGGFVAQHDENSAFARAFEVKEIDGKKVNVLSNGNIIVDTAYYYCLVVGESLSWAIVAMSSSQWKKAKQWNGKIEALRITTPAGPKKAPIYAHSYQLSVERDSNDKGSWWNWKVEDKGQLTSMPLYAAAKEFRKLLIDGVVKAANPDAEGDAQEPASNNGSVPF